MPRIRTIKPEFPQSESMGRVSRDARLLFVQMWTLADDSGRLRGNSRMLASLLFPYDDDAPSLICDWMDELITQKCIVLYSGEDGGAYVQICNWLQHQKIDKPSESKLPRPADNSILETSRTVAKLRENSIPSRARADQGPRTKEGTKDQGSGPGKECCEVALQPSQPASLPDLSKLKYPSFPCVKSRSSESQVFTVGEDLLSRFQETFPAVNVESECRKAHAWIMANGSKRKTAGGMEEFLRRWLAREQDRAMPGLLFKTKAQMSQDASELAKQEFVNEGVF